MFPVDGSCWGAEAVTSAVVVKFEALMGTALAGAELVAAAAISGVGPLLTLAMTKVPFDCCTVTVTGRLPKKSPLVSVAGIN